MERRSFIKIIAGIAVAPLSFLKVAAASTVPVSVVKVRAKPRLLKCRWTLECQRDLEVMGLEEKICC
jgi:hypothetical protein